jgi:O-antigen/teichoic acid export membrane protein
VSFIGRLMGRRSALDDILRTALVNGLAMVCAVATYGLAARILQTNAELAAYSNLRRVNLGLMAVMTLGLGMGLIRFLPLAAQYGANGRRWLLTISLGTVCATLGLTAGLMLALAPSFSELVLGSRQYSELVPGFVLLLLGAVLHSHTAAYFTGRLKMLIANLMQLISIGIVPLLAIALWGAAGVGPVLEATGLGMLAVTLPFLALAWNDSRPSPTEDQLAPPTRTSRIARELLGYGLPRVPGFLAMFGLMSLGPILVAHLGGLAESLYLTIGLQMLTMVLMPVQAMATVFLPRFAELKAQSRHAEAGRIVQLLAAMMLELGLFAALQLIAFVPLLVPLWLKRQDPEGLAVVSVLALAVPAYVTYEALRNPIDSQTVLPLNTYTQLGAVALLVLGSFGLHQAGMPALLAVAVATTTAFLVLGGVTRILALRLFRPAAGLPATWREKLTGPALACLLGAGALALRWLVTGRAAGLILAGIVCYGLAALGIFLWVQRRLGSPWVQELERRIRGRAVA